MLVLFPMLVWFACLLTLPEQVTLVVPKALMAFSNMPERVVTDLPGGKLKEYRFMPSPKVCSAFLLCTPFVLIFCFAFRLVWFGLS